MDVLDRHALTDKPGCIECFVGFRLEYPEALAIIGVNDAIEAARMHLVADWWTRSGLDVKAKLFSVASRECLTTPCVVFDRIRSDQARDWEWLQGLDPRQAAEARSIRARFERNHQDMALNSMKSRR